MKTLNSKPRIVVIDNVGVTLTITHNNHKSGLQ